MVSALFILVLYFLVFFNAYILHIKEKLLYLHTDKHNRYDRHTG